MEGDDLKGAEALTSDLLENLSNSDVLIPQDKDYKIDLEELVGPTDSKTDVAAGIARLLEILGQDHEYDEVCLIDRENSPVDELYSHIRDYQLKGGLENTDEVLEGQMTTLFAHPDDYTWAVPKDEHAPEDGERLTVIEGRFDYEDSVDVIEELEDQGAEVVGVIYLDSSRERPELEEFSEEQEIEFAVPVLTPERAFRAGLVLSWDLDDYAGRNAIEEYDELITQGAPRI